MKSKYLPKLVRYWKLHLSRQIFIALVLLLTMSVLIIGFSSYYLFSNMFSRQVLFSQERTLIQTERTTNSIIRNIEQTVIAETIDPSTQESIVDFVSGGFQNLDSIVARLRNLRNSSRYIFSVYLYLDNEERIITSSDGLWEYRQFYDLEWQDQIPDTRNSRWLSTRTITDNTGQTLQVFSYLVRMNRAPANTDDYLIINISVDELVKSIVNNQSVEGELNFLTDHEGNIIASSIFDWNGQPLDIVFSQEDSLRRLGLETVIQSNYNGWYYINYIPLYFVQNQVRKTAVQTSLILALWLAVGVIIAKILTKRISNPYQTIVDNLQKDHPLNTEENRTMSEADMLKTVIEKIQMQNQTMANKLSESMTQEQESIARSLLLSNPSEIGAKTRHVLLGNEYLPDENKFVILTTIDNASRFIRDIPLQEQSLWRFCMLNILEERIRECGACILSQIDLKNYAFVVSTSFDQRRIYNNCEIAHREIKELLPMSVTMAISTQFEDLEECAGAYNECLELIKHRMELGSSVICEEKINRGSTNDEVEFMNILKRDQLKLQLIQANLTELTALVDKLIKAYINHPNQIAEVIYLQISTILSDAISVAIENGWTLQDFFPEDRNLYQELMEQETAQMMGEWIKEILHQLAPSFKEKKGARNSTIIETILDYLKTHYSEDIRLDMMAEKVFLSPSYLSRLFKQETGNNFIETLTSIRIQAARTELMNAEAKITEIAEKCNFGSTNNFIRLFKKHEGMTPGQYRNMLAKKQLDDPQDAAGNFHEDKETIDVENQSDGQKNEPDN